MRKILAATILICLMVGLHSAGAVRARNADGARTTGRIRGIAAGAPAPRTLSADGGLSVVLLGTGIPLANPERACACTAVIAGDRVFLFDTGRGSMVRFVMAGLPDPDAIFYTHFHSDHFTDLGEFLVNRAVGGAVEPIPVVGPSGMKRVAGGIAEAYALDLEYRVAHHGRHFSAAGASADAREAEPGVVWDQDGVKVTMFGVEHSPVSPAVGYRIDYKGKSVVISGDTAASETLVKHATGCDILVHEAMNDRMIRMAAAGMRSDPRMQALALDVLDYHTPTREVAEIANRAGAGKLVLTHLVPSIPPTETMERNFMSGMSEIYAGTIICGRDGMEIRAD